MLQPQGVRKGRHDVDAQGDEKCSIPRGRSNCQACEQQNEGQPPSRRYEKFPGSDGAKALLGVFPICGHIQDVIEDVHRTRDKAEGDEGADRISQHVEVKEFVGR